MLLSLWNDLALFSKYHLQRRVVDYPAREEALGIVPLAFDLRAYAETLRAYGDRFAVSTLEQLRYRDETYPMLEVRAPKAGAPRLLVLAGVHGNEHAGLLAVPAMLDRWQHAVDLTIVTPVNPVGAAHLSRYNGDGYDINRDFVRFDTVEARVVRDAFDRTLPHFAVSLHEGPQDATFLFANPRVDRALALRLLAALEQRGTTLAARDYFGRALRPPGYAPIQGIGYGLSWLWAKTLGMMATGMYADGRSIPELTIESSWRAKDPAERVRAHVELVLALASELAR
jgi:hypothetical protein